jgi:glycosyltransferase involved in cell wall biosynthesis
MHLAIDAVGNKQAGVKTILLDTLSAAIADPDVSKISVFTSPQALRDFELPASAKLQELPQPAAENFALRLWWYERQLPREVAALQPDVLLCMHSMGQSPRSVPHVTFVQRPLVYSSETRALVKWHQRYRMPVIRAAIGRSCRSAQRIFVHTPTELQSVATEFGISQDRIQIVLPPPRPLPPAALPAPELQPMREAPEGRRMLFVGQLFAHKNVGIIVDAMPELRSRFPDLTFFISGPPTHELRAAPGVEYLGAVPDTALREAYELATFLIMPSLHETIGLPMPEAMSVGTPVVAADRPYAHDVCEDAALFFEPGNESDLVEKVSLMLRDELLQHELRRRGTHLVQKRAQERPYDKLIEATKAVVFGCREASLLDQTGPLPP